MNKKSIVIGVVVGCIAITGIANLMRISYNQGEISGMDKIISEIETQDNGNSTEFCVINDDYYFIGAEVVDYDDLNCIFETVNGQQFEIQGYYTLDNLFLLTMGTNGTPDYYEDDEILVIWELTE